MEQKVTVTDHRQYDGKSEEGLAVHNETIDLMIKELEALKGNPKTRAIIIYDAAKHEEGKPIQYQIGGVVCKDSVVGFFDTIKEYCKLIPGANHLIVNHLIQELMDETLPPCDCGTCETSKKRLH